MVYLIRLLYEIYFKICDKTTTVSLRQGVVCAPIHPLQNVSLRLFIPHPRSSGEHRSFQSISTKENSCYRRRSDHRNCNKETHTQSSREIIAYEPCRSEVTDNRQRADRKRKLYRNVAVKTFTLEQNLTTFATQQLYTQRHGAYDLAISSRGEAIVLDLIIIAL